MVDIESKQSTGMGLLGVSIGQKRAWRGLSEERGSCRKSSPLSQHQLCNVSSSFSFPVNVPSA